MPKNKVKIICYRADQGSCWATRLSFPFTYLARNHPDYAVEITGILDSRQMDIFDVFVAQRQYKSDVYQWLIEVAQKKLGKTIVYEVDDCLVPEKGKSGGILPSWNPAATVYNNKTIQNNVRAFLENVDAIFVATSNLRELYSTYNENVYVLPNSINFEIMHERPVNNKFPVFLWQGSNTHKKDIALLFQALERLDKDEDVYVKLWHTDDGPKGKNIYRVPFCGLEAFYTMLAQMQADVGAAVLVPNRFNAGKSNLKVLEYFSNKIAVAASNFGPYKETVEHEVTGILVDDARNWYEAIRRLIDDIDLRETLVKNAYEFVREKYDISKNYILWKNAIDEILES